MCVYSVNNIQNKEIILARFRERVIEREEEECWEWIAGKQKDGYGAIRVTRRSDGKSVKLQAHRLSYMIYVGDIPINLLVLHSCDNPSCCNPLHLWIGNDRDNMQDKMAKGRSGQTPESLNKLTTSWIGKKHTPETIAKMKESASRRWKKERESKYGIPNNG
jgi:HNH endonuclease/NUMOD3 motif